MEKLQENKNLNSLDLKNEKIPNKIWTRWILKIKKVPTPLGIEPRISGSVDQRLIHWATESFCFLYELFLYNKNLLFVWWLVILISYTNHKLTWIIATEHRPSAVDKADAWVCNHEGPVWLSGWMGLARI
jgi:hypothetical protein